MRPGVVGRGTKDRTQMVDPERIVEGERLDGPARAADGGYVPGACNTMGDFIRSLEDGQFDSDAFEALRELAAAMQEHAWRNGGKSKGKLTISVDFVQDGGVTQMKSAFKVSLPELPRAKSIMWLTPDNRFTRSRPGQHEMFGIRDASAPRGPIRDV